MYCHEAVPHHKIFLIIILSIFNICAYKLKKNIYLLIVFAKECFIRLSLHTTNTRAICPRIYDSMRKKSFCYVMYVDAARIIARIRFSESGRICNPEYGQYCPLLICMEKWVGRGK